MPANNPQPTKGEKFSLTISTMTLEESRLVIAFRRKLDDKQRREVLGLVEHWTASRTARN